MSLKVHNAQAWPDSGKPGGGWVIACSDGVVRCYPYANQGDAEHDVGVYARRGRCSHEGCPGPAHSACRAPDTGGATN